MSTLPHSASNSSPPSFKPTIKELHDLSWMRAQGKRGYKTPTGHVYLISNGELVKIGRSIDAERRFKQLKYATGKPSTLIYYKDVTWPTALETALHITYWDKSRAGEWFNLTPSDIEQAKRYIALWSWMDGIMGLEVGCDRCNPWQWVYQ